MQARTRASCVAALFITMTATGAGAVRAQSTAARSTVELPASVARVLRDYESAWTARDAARLAALFDADGYVLTSGSAPVRGRAAIAEHYRRAGGPLHLRAIAYAAQDTIGYVIGMYSGADRVERGKFVLALRRRSSNEPWLIAADMDNSNSR